MSHNNISHNGDDGIWLVSADNTTITHNTFINNDGMGIWVDSSDNTKIENNIFNDNSIDIDDGNDNIIRYNNVTLYSRIPPQWYSVSGSGNIDEDNNLLFDDWREYNDLFSYADNYDFDNPDYYEDLKAYDDDWFYANIDQDKLFFVSINFSVFNDTLDLFLYDSNRVLLNSSTTGSPSRTVSYNPTYSGNYYILITGGMNSEYNLTIDIYIPPAPPDAPQLEYIWSNPDYDGIIDLEWNDVADATIYFVYRDNSFISSIIGLIPIASTATSHYQDTITFDGTYYYVIIAGNVDGNRTGE